MKKDPLHNLQVPKKYRVAAGRPMAAKYDGRGKIMAGLRKDANFEAFFQKVNYQCSLDGKRRAIIKDPDGELFCFASERNGHDLMRFVKPLLDRFSCKYLISI